VIGFDDMTIHFSAIQDRNRQMDRRLSTAYPALCTSYMTIGVVFG